MSLGGPSRLVHAQILSGRRGLVTDSFSSLCPKPVGMSSLAVGQQKRVNQMWTCQEKTKKALLDTLVELGLAPALPAAKNFRSRETVKSFHEQEICSHWSLSRWDCLSRQRLYFMSEGFSEADSTRM